MINGMGNQLGNRCVPQGPSNNNTNFIRDKDTDGDGLLNAEELGAPEEDFVKIDTNGDGLADREELTIAYINRNRSAPIDNKPNQFIRDKDTDGDGLLNAEELGAPEEDFVKIDTNGDGLADRVELAMAYREINREPDAQASEESEAQGVDITV